MSTILHVEDESSIRLLYREVFEELGFEIIQAVSAEEALVLLRSHRPDIIILDLKMPGMGGRAFIKKFQKLKMRIPIVVSTAYPYMSGDPILSEVDAFILKSGDLDGLINKVKELLRNRLAAKD